MIIVQTAQRVIGVWNSAVSPGSSSSDPLDGATPVVTFDKLELCEQRVGWMKNADGNDFICSFTLPPGDGELLVQVREPGVPVTIDLLTLTTSRDASSYITQKGVVNYTDLNIIYSGPQPRPVSREAAVSATLLQHPWIVTNKGDSSAPIRFQMSSTTPELHDALTAEFTGLPIEGGSVIERSACGTRAWPYEYVAGQKQDWLRTKFSIGHHALFKAVDRGEELKADPTNVMRECVLGALGLMVEEARKTWVFKRNDILSNVSFSPTTRPIATTYYVNGVDKHAVANSFDSQTSRVMRETFSVGDGVPDACLESYSFSRYNDIVRQDVLVGGLIDESTHFLRVRTHGANVSIKIGVIRK